jgi:hypothetical protein
MRKMMDSIPAGPLRDKALDRVRRLDCTNPDSTLASCSPTAEDISQGKSFEHTGVDDLTYAKSLAAVLKGLVCNGVEGGAFYFTGRFSLSTTVRSTFCADSHTHPQQSLPALGPLVLKRLRSSIS